MSSQNIEKAKKEIERLEAEEAAEASGAATPNGANGKKGEDKAVAEVTEAAKNVSVEEKKEPVAVTADEAVAALKASDPQYFAGSGTQGSGTTPNGGSAASFDVMKHL